MHQFAAQTIQKLHSKTHSFYPCEEKKENLFHYPVNGYCQTTFVACPLKQNLEVYDVIKQYSLKTNLKVTEFLWLYPKFLS